MAQVGTVVVALVVVFSTPVFTNSIRTWIEQGRWNLNINQDQQLHAVSKHMFQGNKVKFSVSLKCKGLVPDHIQLSWLLLKSPCVHDFMTLTQLPSGANNTQKIQSEKTLETLVRNPSAFQLVYDYTVEWMNDVASYDCSSQEFVYEHKTDQKPQNVYSKPKNTDTGAVPNAQGYRRKRAAAGSLAVQEKRKSNISDQVFHVDVGDTWGDGYYMFVLHMQPVSKTTQFSAEVTIRMLDQNGNYISALDYPMIPVSIVMGLVYVVYCLVWLTMIARNRKNPLLHRVHFLIGGAIVLCPCVYGLQLVQMEIVNRTGHSISAVDIFAFLVSCFTMTVFMVLSIALSLGYGVVRPHLTGKPCKYVFVGSLYFILQSIALIGMFVVTEPSVWFVLLIGGAVIILAFTIFIWMIVNVVKTLRFLRTACHPVKRSVYVRVIISQVFFFFVLLGLQIGISVHFNIQQCVKDWKYQRWSTSGVDVLSAISFLIVMILWRPTASNLRRAFAPLDENADEKEIKDEEDTLWEKTQPTKMVAPALETSTV